MNGSNHLGELDSRPLHLCPVCLRKLQWSVGFDAVMRDERLLSVVEEAGWTAERTWLSDRLIRLSSHR
jgi:archaemetzincin